VAVRDYRDSAGCLFIRDDDRDLDRYGDHTGKRIDACGDETGYRQHSFVAVVIGEAWAVEIDRPRCGRTVTRKVRVHLPRVVVSGLVVVEMHVRHRSGDGAHLDGNG
jgi:hypothetical protein